MKFQLHLFLSLGSPLQQALSIYIHLILLIRMPRTSECNQCNRVPPFSNWVFVLNHFSMLHTHIPLYRVWMGIMDCGHVLHCVVSSENILLLYCCSGVDVLVLLHGTPAITRQPTSLSHHSCYILVQYFLLILVWHYYFLLLAFSNHCLSWFPTIRVYIPLM